MSVSGGSVTEATISSLMPSTNYSIQVAAVNIAGVGVYSDPPVIIMTLPSKTHVCYMKNSVTFSKLKTCILYCSLAHILQLHTYLLYIICVSILQAAQDNGIYTISLSNCCLGISRAKMLNFGCMFHSKNHLLDMAVEIHRTSINNSNHL